MTKEALTLALEALEYPLNISHEGFNVDMAELLAHRAITAIKEALAQPEQEKERCVGCEACIDTACGRDECPKGWPKALQPEQEPVAWMLEGWGPDCGPYFEIYRNDEMGWRDKKEWTPLYTTPPQRKPLTDEEIGAILEGVNAYGTRLYTFARAIEAAHSIKGDA